MSCLKLPFPSLAFSNIGLLLSIANHLPSLWQPGYHFSCLAAQRPTQPPALLLLLMQENRWICVFTADTVSCCRVWGWGRQTSFHLAGAAGCPAGEEWTQSPGVHAPGRVGILQKVGFDLNSLTLASVKKALALKCNETSILLQWGLGRWHQS